MKLLRAAGYTQFEADLRTGQLISDTSTEPVPELVANGAT